MRKSLQTVSTVAQRPLRQGVRGSAFWAAVVLPLAYLPILAGELSMMPALPMLLVGHAVCLLLGHGWSSPATVTEEDPA